MLRVTKTFLLYRKTQKKRFGRKDGMKYWISMASLTGLDLLIKRIVETCIQLDDKKYVLKDRLIIRKHHNDGAIFDSFPAKKSVIYAISYALFGFFAGLFVTEKSKVKKAGLMLLLSGALSNAMDRLQFGYVIDYFTVVYGRLKRIIFNLGDWFLFVGVTIWSLAEIFGDKKKIEKKVSES